MATDKQKNRLADLVKEIRGYRSQRAFAAAIGVSFTAVQHWEKGANTPFFPNDGNLIKLADAKGWTLQELKNYLATGVRPDINEFERLLDQLHRLQPDQVSRAIKAIADRTQELLETYIKDDKY